MREETLEPALRHLERGKGCNSRLHGGGRFFMDRPLPFLAVYRRGRTTVPGEVEKIVSVHAAFASFNCHDTRALEGIRRCADIMGKRFGAFLMIEFWPDYSILNARTRPGSRLRPFFDIRVSKATARELSDPLTILEKSLRGIEVHRRAARTRFSSGVKDHPAGLPSLLEPGSVRRRLFSIGVQVRPIFINLGTRELFPLLFQRLLEQLSLAVKETFFEFARTKTAGSVSHYYSLGPRRLTPAIGEADARLGACADSFSFLLQVTPLNAEAAWRAFSRKKFETSPLFLYRPLPIDPELLKRRLYSIELERVEDPTLAALFRRKRDEIDRQLTMLFDIDTPRFLHGSLQLYGGVGADLLRLAEEILNKVAPADEIGKSRKETVGENGFARRAREEIAGYRRADPAFNATVEIREDIPPGILVSGRVLYIGKGTRLACNRIEALIQHEVATHLLTYFNGRAQPLEQFHSGLAGYEELQEGLATFGEYLAGQLDAARLRLLAARVVSVASVLDGASFVETFRLLSERCVLAARSAFMTAMRVHRGGGLTKDAIYLRGLRDLLVLLQEDHVLSDLYLGKISFDQIPLVEELLHRKILKKAPLLPRIFADDGATRRYENARRGLAVIELCNGSK